MSQYKPACHALAPDLKLVAPARPATTFIQYFVGYIDAAQILSNKDKGRLDILLLMLYTEGVIASGQGQKKCRTPTCEWVKHSQLPGALVAVASCNNGDIE